MYGNPAMGKTKLNYACNPYIFLLHYSCLKNGRDEIYPYLPVKSLEKQRFSTPAFRQSFQIQQTKEP